MNDVEIKRELFCFETMLWSGLNFEWFYDVHKTHLF